MPKAVRRIHSAFSRMRESGSFFSMSEPARMEKLRFGVAPMKIDRPAQIAGHRLGHDIGPGLALPLTAPKHFARPMTSPNTSSWEFSGVSPMNDLG